MRRATELNRRAFLRLSANVAAAAGLAGYSLRAGQAEAPAADKAGVNPVSELDDFNYAVGTQTIGAKYQFSAKPRLLETAEAIRDMGASVIKLSLGHTKKQGAQPDDIQSLHDVAARDPVMRDIFNMPFGYFILWTYPLGKGGNPQAWEGERDEEIYDLCCYLLKTYNRSRKTFYLGHWEGDWELRGRAALKTRPRSASQIKSAGSIVASKRWMTRSETRRTPASRCIAMPR